MSAMIVAVFGGSALAADVQPPKDGIPPLDQVELAQLHMAALTAASSTGPIEAIAKGTTKVLEAVILEVRGRCQWKASEEDAWQKAAKDHRLKPGALIRTGLRSHLALRCGPNATILVDSNSRVAVPALAQNGETLSTIVQVERGRADFKVDRVGLTNDFSVVTPSGALSVRGTGMGVAYDGFKGASVYGARFNSINAIEMRYYGSKKVWSVSGGGATSNRSKNPAKRAVSRAVGGKKPINKAHAMDAKGVAKGGPSPRNVDGGLRETTRLVLGAEQSVREAQRREAFQQEFRDAEAARNPPPGPPSTPPGPPSTPPGPPSTPPAEPPQPPPPPVEPPPVDPPDDTEPPEEPADDFIIDLPGYQSYFREVVSPTDRGMLATKVFLDLVPENYMSDYPISMGYIGQNDAGENGVAFRSRIPTKFEPLLAQLVTVQQAEALGIRRGEINVGLTVNYNDIPDGAPIQNMGDLYGQLLRNGSQRYIEWSEGGQGPMDHDLDVMLQVVNQFANVPEFANQPVEVREAFAASLAQTLYDKGAFTTYGKELQQFTPGGGIQPPPPPPPGSPRR